MFTNMYKRLRDVLNIGNIVTATCTKKKLMYYTFTCRRDFAAYTEFK